MERARKCVIGWEYQKTVGLMVQMVHLQKQAFGQRSAIMNVRIETRKETSPCYARRGNKTFNNTVLSIDGDRPPPIDEVCVVEGKT